MTANCNTFTTSLRRAADKDGEGATGGSGHHEESFEEFTARYATTGGFPALRPSAFQLVAGSTLALTAAERTQLADDSYGRYEKEFDGVQDVFELQVGDLAASDPYLQPSRREV